MSNVSLQEITNVIAPNFELSKAAAHRIGAAIFDALTATLNSGEDVRISGFGTFKQEFKAPTSARNPKTGEPVSVPAKRKVTFKPSKGTFVV